LLHAPAVIKTATAVGSTGAFSAAISNRELGLSVDPRPATRARAVQRAESRGPARPAPRAPRPSRSGPPRAPDPSTGAGGSPTPAPPRAAITPEDAGQVTGRLKSRRLARPRPAVRRTRRATPGGAGGNAARALSSSARNVPRSSSLVPRSSTAGLRSYPPHCMGSRFRAGSLGARRVDLALGCLRAQEPHAKEESTGVHPWMTGGAWSPTSASTAVSAGGTSPSTAGVTAFCAL